MYSVLSMGGSITGYVVGNYHLPVDMARFFFDDLSVSKSVYGGRHGVFFISEVTGETVPVKSVCATTFSEFRQSCLSEDISLHDTLFVPCQYQDFDWYETNGIWTVRGLHIYQCRHYGGVIGYIATDRDIFMNKSVTIAMIEVVEKRKGYGTIIVNELKSRGISLRGLSVVGATSFWESLGAVMFDCNRFKL